MPLAAGSRLGPYEIVSAIGSGGMGVVYRARDTRLGRIVAIKLAGPSMDDAGGRRLMREAQHASALNHPNICVLHEIGEADGQPFIVLEYVDGQPLSALIEDGGLPIDAAISFASQIAAALAHAHAHGVVHRDLKPANIVITPDRRVKVLDFGLAQRVWHDGAAYSATLPQTQPGVVAGTIAYMAPEALRGAPPDARSDIWALGVILHEMVTGAAPFRGHTEFELSSRILHDAPPELPPSVPAAIRRTVSRCLAKDAHGRFANATDICDALAGRAIAEPRPATPDRTRFGRTLLVGAATLAAVAAGVLGVIQWQSHRQGTTASPGAVQSLAVLPLENLSHDDRQDYLADGMTDALITTLSKLGEWRVISRTSVMQYKGVHKPLPEIARTLDVDDIIEGSVLQAGTRVRISAQLIKAAREEHLWAESYERDTRDIFQLQSDVAAAVATQIRGTLRPRDQQQMRGTAPANPAAYDLYLRGRYHVNQFTLPNINQAIVDFQKGIEIDPAYGVLFAGLADAYYDLSSVYASPRQMMPKVRAAATRALELDERLAEAHTDLALVSQAYDYDWAAAEAHYKRALELNPNYAGAREMYGDYLVYRGRFAESRQQFDRAHELDPLTPRIEVSTVLPSLYEGRYDECVLRWRAMIAGMPDFYAVHAYLGIAYLQQGRFGLAITALERARQLEDVPWVSGWLGHAYARGGRRADAERILAALENRAEREYVLPYGIAIIYIALNDYDAAFKWLERGYEQRDEQLTLLKFDPVFDPLRGDARFADLMRRVRIDR
jgi:eukaryotic-like serine/threonine-protein kinase